MQPRIRMSALCLFWSVCAGSAYAQAPGGDGESPPVPVVLQTVAEASIDERSEFIARVQAIESVDIRAQVDGLIAEVGFSGGERVSEGDLLFSIDPAQYEAALAAARARLSRAEASRDNAEQTFRRTDELAGRGTVSQASLDEAEAGLRGAEAEVETARAEVRSAELNLSYTTIRSPIAGRIGLPMITRGNLVGSGSGALARVVQTDPVYVSFNIPEGEMVSLRQEYGPALDAVGSGAAGSDAVDLQLRLPNGTLYSGAGRIAVIGNEINPQTGMLSLRARFENGDNILLPGQFVTLSIGASDPETAPFVGQPAVLRDREGQFVFVVDEAGTAHQRRIVTGARAENGWFVTEGLETGERIVIEGIQRVSDGARVADIGDPAIDPEDLLPENPDPEDADGEIQGVPQQ